MEGQFNNMEEAIKALRCQRIKENKAVWLLFGLSSLLAFLCPLLINYKFCDISYPIENAVLNGVANISFGYFSGFLVYLFITFIPNTKKEVMAWDSIYFRLYLLSNALESIDKHILPDIGAINVKTYESSVFNFLVDKANVLDISDEEQIPKTLPVNERHFTFVLRLLTMVQRDVNLIITTYSNELEYSDVEILMNLSGLKDDFMDAKRGDYYLGDTLICFISSLHSLGNLQLRHVANKYCLYGYCEYKIERIKINYKNEY